MQLLTVCQHNILAPVWINDSYRYLPCYLRYISPERLSVTLNYLSALCSADVYCLNEVEANQLSTISNHFKEYKFYFGSNKEGFWTEWLNSKEWVANGTCLLIKKKYKIVESKIIDFEDGCRGLLAKFIIEDKTIVNIIGVHFDNGDAKYVEARKLLNLLKYDDNFKNEVIIISGDYNFTNLEMFYQDGYLEPIQLRHNNNNFKKIENSTPIPQGIIDHTVIKNGFPICQYIDAFDTMDNINKFGNVTKIVRNLCETVEKNGSDHYATISYFAI